jgi:hypothetical protein
VETWEVIDVLNAIDQEYNGRSGTRIAHGQTRNGRYLTQTERFSGGFAVGA